MTDQLSIANRSLLAIGARTQVSSINPSDGSVEANAISVLWTPTFEQLGRTAQWNCLRKQTTLALLAAAQGTPENPSGNLYPLPPIPWLYQYALPSDCLLMRYIVPSYPACQTGLVPQTSINNAAGTWLPGGGQIPYVVSSAPDPNNTPISVIFTNQSQAQAVYTANEPNPVRWDSLFQAAMVASLAAFLVPALSLSLPLMQMCIKEAEMIITVARAQDGNEGVTTMDHTPDWIMARAGGSGWGPGWGAFPATYGLYGGMCWPNYGNTYG